MHDTGAILLLSYEFGLQTLFTITPLQAELCSAETSSECFGRLKKTDLRKRY